MSRTVRAAIPHRSKPLLWRAIARTGAHGAGERSSLPRHSPRPETGRGRKGPPAPRGSRPRRAILSAGSGSGAAHVIRTLLSRTPIDIGQCSPASREEL